MRLLLLVCLLTAPAWSTDPASEAFFRRLAELDGKTATGMTLFPTDPAHEMVGKPLELRFEKVSDTELRVPFRVGDDASRTWILRLTDGGLVFKHDHGHDPVTNYGGVAVPGLMSGVQLFPADEETTRLLPEAATNVWCLMLSPDGSRLTYSLERHHEPRYQAVFELRR